MTLDQLLTDLRQRLFNAGVSEAGIEARLLLGGVLKLSSTEILLNGQHMPRDDELACVEQAATRRLAGEPVHRILGSRNFFGLDLRLGPDTLEPRCDTEALVETMIPYLEKTISAKGTARILDLGTGTGAICLALLKVASKAHGFASDISRGALLVASENAHIHGLDDRFTPVESCWFDNISGKFDLIVSNPPYIASGVIATLALEVRHFDPLLALDGGQDGLDAYRAIAKAARDHLYPGAVLGLEIGYDQKQPVGALFAAHGFGLLHSAKDIGGNDRVLVFSRDRPQ